MNNLNTYEAIKNIIALDKLNNAIELCNLKKSGISYVSLGMKEYIGNNGATIIPNLEWKNIIEKNKFYHYDPIFRSATLTNKNYVLYSRFKYNTEFERKIFNERINMEMNKGLIKIIHYNSFRIAFTFSSGWSKFCEADFLIKNHAKICKLEDYSKSIIKDFLIK